MREETNAPLARQWIPSIFILRIFLTMSSFYGQNRKEPEAAALRFLNQCELRLIYDFWTEAHHQLPYQSAA